MMIDFMSLSWHSSMDRRGLKIATRGMFSACAMSSNRSATFWFSKGTANQFGFSFAICCLN